MKRLAWFETTDLSLFLTLIRLSSHTQILNTHLQVSIIKSKHIYMFLKAFPNLISHTDYKTFFS